MKNAFSLASKVHTFYQKQLVVNYKPVIVKNTQNQGWILQDVCAVS